MIFIQAILLLNNIIMIRWQKLLHNIPFGNKDMNECNLTYKILSL